MTTTLELLSAAPDPPYVTWNDYAPVLAVAFGLLALMTGFSKLAALLPWKPLETVSKASEAAAAIAGGALFVDAFKAMKSIDISNATEMQKLQDWRSHPYDRMYTWASVAVGHWMLLWAAIIVAIFTVYVFRNYDDDYADRVRTFRRIVATPYRWLMKKHSTSSSSPSFPGMSWIIITESATNLPAKSETPTENQSGPEEMYGGFSPPAH